MTTPENIQVVVIPETFQLESKDVIGVVYFTFDTDYAFPDNKWDDFVVIILGWWVDAALALFTGQEKLVVLYFMDGSFQVNLEGGSSDIWKMECLFRGRDEIRHTGNINRNVFLTELASAVSITIK